MKSVRPALRALRQAAAVSIAILVLLGGIWHLGELQSGRGPNPGNSSIGSTDSGAADPGALDSSVASRSLAILDSEQTYESLPEELSPAQADKLTGAKRSRVVDVDVDEWASTLGPGRHELKLFDDVVLDLASSETVHPGAGGTRTWSGLTPSGDWATITFAEKEVFVLAGYGGAKFDLSPGPRGSHFLIEDGRELPPGAFDDDVRHAGSTTETMAPPHDRETETVWDEHKVQAAFSDAPLAPAGTPVVTILTVYDHTARNYYGGDGPAQAELAATINEMNAVHSRSGTGVQIASAGIELINYWGSGDLSLDLDRLKTNGDSSIDEVHARRDATQADLVHLVQKASPDYGAVGFACSAGFPYPTAGVTDGCAFGVTQARWARSELVMTHEVGHNLGAGHGYPDDGSGVLEYSKGVIDEGHRFNTVMTYQCPNVQCSTIGYFSTPVVTYNGWAIGSDSQDNAATIRLFGAAISAYRGGCSSAARPANDNFANATAFSLLGNSSPVMWSHYWAGTSYCATTEIGEPSDLFGARTVWWKFTAPADGVVRLAAENPYCNFGLAAYTGTSVSALTLVSTDASEITFSVQKNKTYSVALGVPFSFVEEAPYVFGVVSYTPPVGAATKSTAYLAEGATKGGFDTWVVAANPSTTETAWAKLTFLTSGGPVAGPVTPLLPGTRKSFKVDNYVDTWDVSTKVEGLLAPVVAERAMYSSSPGYQGAHLGKGISTPATSWFLPEGSAGPGFETWVLVANPSSSTTANVTITYLTPAGARTGPTFGLPPQTRKSVRANDSVPGEWEVSTKVQSTGTSVIAERATYVAGGRYRGATVAPGTPAAATSWFLGEGSTGPGFETWILVANPHASTSANVQVQYMTSSGPVTGPSFALPPNSRRSVKANDVVPGDWDVSTKVTSTGTGVVVERATYTVSGSSFGMTAAAGEGVTAAAHRWILAEGSTGPGFETWTLAANPSASQSATVTITYLTASGAVAGPTFTLPPNSRRSFKANNYVPGQWDVAAKVVATGTAVVVDHAVYAPPGASYDSTSGPGVPY